MIELIGWLSSIALCLSGIPFAYQSWRRGASGCTLWGVLPIFGGMVGFMVYELGTAQSLPQLASYLTNVLSWGVVLWYTLKPRTRNAD